MSISYDEVLINGSTDELNEYMWDYDKNVVVDWRGGGDEIVIDIAKKINDPSLSAEYMDDALKIVHGEKSFDLPYELSSESAQARYVTINKVRELIKDEYGIRVWRESTLSDTHSLYVKDNEWWRFMDEKFPEDMNNLFVKITEDTQFF